MKFSGTLIAVQDIQKSKQFYQTIMEQTISMDLGVHVAFESGLALQSNYEQLVGVPLSITQKSNNFQLYFEVDDIDHYSRKLHTVPDIEFIDDTKEYPWGQRVLRIYDFDKHIIEVAESMESVAKRFLRQGLSVEETAERTMFPLSFINHCRDTL